MIESLRHAYDGIVWSFRHHVNFRIHAGIALLVILFALFLHVTAVEFILLIFTITFMFIVEMINTSLEEITNLVTLKWAHQAKIAKDVAAGMALITALSTVIVGTIIFIPYILNIATTI